MPKREDINKVLIIGSGPIVIGQACEFDYSGTQACKALRNLGYEVALVNSNPATIMTDPVMADETYIEPLNVPTLEAIIKQSKPDALLPNLGGQTGLNLSTALDRAGILAANDVQMIGITQDVIERGEDRETFKRTMAEIGVDMPRSQTVGTGRGRPRLRRRGRLPDGRPPRLHDGRHRRRVRALRRRDAHHRAPRPAGLADHAGPGRGVDPRLGGARGRGHPRRQEPDDQRLLHRERGRRGRPHRRLLLQRPDDHHRPGAAGRAAAHRPHDRERDRRHRRHQRAAGAQPEDGARGRHRDQPAHVASARRWRPRPPACRSPWCPRCWRPA